MLSAPEDPAAQAIIASAAALIAMNGATPLPMAAELEPAAPTPVGLLLPMA